MKSSLVFCTLALTCGIALGCTGTSYDFVEVVQQWPQTNCRDSSCNNLDGVNYFTLHGLWPTNTDGSYPCYCTNAPFNETDVSSIESELDKFWPSYYGASSGFWSHEWTKHGTCMISPWNTVLPFFKEGLAQHTKLDIAGALAKANIVPSDTTAYDINDVYKALESVLGVSGSFACSSSNIVSATVCLDKNMNVMTCPSSQYNSSCQGKVYLRATPQ